MSRYTQRDEYGNADIIGVDSADLQLNLEFKEFNRVTDALNRLAAYEDTGLEPEVCANYKAFEDEAISKGITFNRIVELMEADKDGLCVVLPCKVGDTVYEALLEWDCTECLKTSFKPKVRERKVTHFMFGKSGDIIVGVSGDGADYLIYGKTVFLTRAEAEEALKGGTA